MASSYVLIFDDYCTKDLQQQIEQHSEFENCIRDDPVELINTINVLIQSPVIREYWFHPLKTALTNFMTIRQYNEENVITYQKRFNQLRDIAEAQVGKSSLYTFIQNNEDFKTAPDQITRNYLAEKAWNEWCAFLLFDGINRNKYGTLHNEIRQQYTQGVNQYPRDTMVVVDMVGDRKIDQK